MAPRPGPATGRTPWNSSWPPGQRMAASGIAPRSRRGSFGTSWWARRFVAALESVAGPGRLARGRSYARSRQVLDLELAPGRARAAVQGSRSRPYAVDIGLRTWSEEEVEALAGAVAASPALVSAVLAGALPEDLERVCGEAGLPLFPESAAEVAFSCTCPDLVDPCKHAAAVVYLLAERLDADPFAVLVLRGTTREQLLSAVVARTTGRAGSAPGPAPAASAPATSVWRRTRALPAAPLPDGDALDALDASLLGAGGGVVVDLTRRVVAGLREEGEPRQR